MSENYSISIVIDENHGEKFYIRTREDIKKLMKMLSSKYKFNEELNKKLSEKINECFNEVKKKKYMLTLYEKEIVDNLYQNPLKKKEELNEKILDLKEREFEEEFKNYTFSPKISFKAKNFERQKDNKHIFAEHDSFAKYNKSKKAKDHVDLMRIMKKVEEMKECTQFISYDDVRRQHNENKKHKFKLKYPPNSLKIRKEYRFTLLPTKKIISSNKSLNETVRTNKTNKTNKTIRTIHQSNSKIITTRRKNSYADLFKLKQELSVNNSNLSILTDRSKLVTPQKKFESKKSMRFSSKNLNPIASQNDSYDKGNPITSRSSRMKSTKVIPTVSAIKNFNNIFNTPPDEGSFSNIMSSKNIKSNLNINFIDKNESEKENLKSKKTLKEIKQEKNRRKLNSIDKNMPKSFKEIIKKGNDQELKVKTKNKLYMKLECPFSPKINSLSEKICSNMPGREKNVITRLTSATTKTNVNRSSSSDEGSFFTPQSKTNKFRHVRSTDSTMSEKDVKAFTFKPRDYESNENEKVVKLRKKRKEQIADIYRELSKCSSIDECIENNMNIEPGIKQKIVNPVLMLIKDQHLECNFHNFYLLFNELDVLLNEKGKL